MQNLTKQEKIIVSLLRGNHLNNDELEQAKQLVHVLKLNLNNRFLYYQPDFNGNDELIKPNGEVLHSFEVYKSLDNAKQDFPNRDIIAYSGNDIEEPTYID